MLSPLIERLRATSLRTRLAVWNAAVVVALTAVTLLTVQFAARSALYADADAELRAASHEVALAVHELEGDQRRILSELRRKAASHEERGWFVQLLMEDGATIWKSDHCPEDVANFPPADIEQWETVRQVGQYRYVRTRVDQPNGDRLLVRVGTYTTGLDESLSGLMRVLAVMALVLSAATPAVAWWLAGRATRPINTMLQTAERLSPTRLGDRLPVRGTPDELDKLAITINGLLDSVAHHVGNQEQFVADAAHELRGPLAALQSSMEVAVSRGQVSAHTQESLSDMLEATRHLSKVANDLLLLAEAGQGGRPAHHVVVDLGAVAHQTVSMFAGVAEDRGVALSIDAAASAGILGDPIDLRRLVSNLLDNAIRFTPPGGSVTVRVVTAADRVVLTVADTGAGITPRHLEHVFDRFFKADPSRTHGAGHRSSGLGLAICRSLVESCGGTITIASRVGEGTTVTVRLPAASAPGLRDPGSQHIPDPVTLQPASS